MSRGPCDCPERLLGLPHVHSPCHAQDAAAGTQPCARRPGHTSGTGDTWGFECQGKTLLSVWKWPCWKYRPGGSCHWPWGVAGDEQTQLFHRAEQLWGGSGWWGWPESTVMGLGWHCHRVTPRLSASGARAAWGTLCLRPGDAFRRVGSTFPSLWGPGGCEGRGTPSCSHPGPQAETFCLDILQKKCFQFFLSKTAVHWETHCIFSAGKNITSETFNSAQGGFPQALQTAQGHGSTCTVPTPPDPHSPQGRD